MECRSRGGGVWGYSEGMLCVCRGRGLKEGLYGGVVEVESTKNHHKSLREGNS